MSSFLMAIDQGTTSTRAMIFNSNGTPVAKHQLEFPQYFPAPGCVEHDPEDLWQSTLVCCQQAILNAQLNGQSIAAIGITNQRETTIMWDRATGTPIYRAIVWQDRRTQALCASLRAAGHEAMVQAKTGLLLDPYFSASKIAWLLDNVPNARTLAEQGRLAFGTVDSFLLWRLSGGTKHATDATNAARTLLFNIHTQRWDDDLLKLFNIPASLLPKVFDNTENFSHTDEKFFGYPIPITAMAGDQHAALVGQTCFQPGMAKSTYGTGTFLMLNTGHTPLDSKNRLLTTIAYKLNGQVTYALEGSTFAAGSIVQWLRDKLGIIKTSAETEGIAGALTDNGGVYFIPAFTGLGAPYWDPNIRASIQGLTRDSTAAHIIRAGLEAVAYQTRDLLEAMRADGAETSFTQIRVDGGMVTNNWLMQFLADVLELQVQRAELSETTALGVAYLAGLQVGIFDSLEEIIQLRQQNTTFHPSTEQKTAQECYFKWRSTVKALVAH